MSRLLRYFSFVILVFSVSVWATPDDVRDRSRWLQAELHLSRQQKKEIKRILNEYAPSLTEIRERSEEARVEVRKLFRSAKKGKSHSKELIDKFENSRELRNIYHRRRFMMALEIRNVLNEEQLMKLNSLKEFNKR